MRVRKSGLYFVTVFLHERAGKRVSIESTKNYVRSMLRALEREAYKKHWRYKVQGVLADTSIEAPSQRTDTARPPTVTKGNAEKYMYMLLWSTAGASVIGALERYQKAHGRNGIDKGANGLMYEKLTGERLTPQTVKNIQSAISGAYQRSVLRLSFVRASVNCTGKDFVSLSQSQS